MILADGYWFYLRINVVAFRDIYHLFIENIQIGSQIYYTVLPITYNFTITIPYYSIIDNIVDVPKLEHRKYSPIAQKQPEQTNPLTPKTKIPTPKITQRQSTPTLTPIANNNPHQIPIPPQQRTHPIKQIPQKLTPHNKQIITLQTQIQTQTQHLIMARTIHQTTSIYR